MGLIFETKCLSFTGYFIYSDTYAVVPSKQKTDAPTEMMIPVLNQWAAIPILGILAGITRVALAAIHILGHLLATLVYRNKGHLMHAAKGVAELLRGAIEAVPFLGRGFVWLFDAPGINRFRAYRKNNEPLVCFAFFLIKIRNPRHLDYVDHAMLGRSSYKQPLQRV
jgi:hypothetical protein